MRRRAVVLQAGRGDLLIGPDNGLLLPAARRVGGVERAYSLENENLFEIPVHPTFHGRDIFAPAAAHLSLGIPPREAGPQLDEADLVPAPWEKAKVGEGAIYALVIDVDRFGSLRLNAYPDQVKSLGYREGDAVLLGVGEGELEATYVSTFGEVEKGDILLFEDSSGVMAAGINGGSLARTTGATPGNMLIIYRVNPPHSA